METSAVSDIKNIAITLFNRFQSEGAVGVRNFLVEVIGVQEDTAKVLAEGYKPKKHPEVSDDAHLMPSSTIFELLQMQTNSWPKNRIAWEALRHLLGDTFDFHIPPESRHAVRQNKILFHALPCNEEGQGVKLGHAALGIVQNKSEFPSHVVRKALAFQQFLGKEVGGCFTETLLKSGMIFPPDRIVKSICETIRRGVDGEKIILTGAFCPDYSYEETGDPTIPYRYTFDSVGDGVGLVAKQFTRVLPYLASFFNEFGINFEVYSNKIGFRI